MLSRLDPGVAAEALLEQLDGTPRRGSFVDMVPLFYGAALLDGPGAPTTCRRSARSPPIVRPRSASMMDFVDAARRASAQGDTIALRELERTVRRGLTTLAGRQATRPVPGRRWPIRTDGSNDRPVWSLLMTTKKSASVGMISIDAPDAAVLAHFYADLLELDVLHEGDGYAMIGADGTTPIGFGTDPHYARAVVAGQRAQAVPPRHRRDRPRGHGSQGDRVGRQST